MDSTTAQSMQVSYMFENWSQSFLLFQNHYHFSLEFFISPEDESFNKKTTMLIIPFLFFVRNKIITDLF